MPGQDCSKYDDFLSHVGEFGAYQKRLLTVMMLAAFLFGFTYFGQIFMVLVPEHHWCYIPELKQLPIKQQQELGIPKDKEGNYEKCVRYDVAFDSIKLNTTKADESWPRKPCDKGWNYSRTEIPYDTIATQGDWVCKDKELATYSSVIYFLGSVVGCICFGYMSDHCGRVMSLFLANSCALIGGVLSSLCEAFGFFSFTRFIVGMALDSCFTPIYILVMENVGRKYRALIGNLPLAIAFPLAIAVLPWIAYFIRIWRIFALVIAVPVAVLVFLCVVIPESPSWLLSVGRIEKCMKGLKQMAEVNGKTLSDGEWLEMQTCFELARSNQESERTYNFLDLFKSCRRAAIILMLIANWSVVCVIYDAHVRLSTSFGTNIFITFSLAALIEIPAGILPLFLVNLLGRKPLMILAFLPCAAFSFLAGMLSGKLGIAVAASIARFFATVAYNVAQQWSVEILPTVVRGQGWAVINVVGHSAALISPIVLYARHYYRPLPMFIIALISAIGSVVIICLPETKGTYLPQTLEEAEKRWTLRCRKAKEKESQ
ncbi:hypothetical protein KR054_010943 [Drosophila jambulina]|nr:hypothetical protein KR054_010943 [Drosophila jambulina]